MPGALDGTQGLLLVHQRRGLDDVPGFLNDGRPLHAAGLKLTDSNGNGTNFIGMVSGAGV